MRSQHADGVACDPRPLQPLLFTSGPKTVYSMDSMMKEMAIEESGAGCDIIPIIWDGATSLPRHGATGRHFI